MSKFVSKKGVERKRERDSCFIKISKSTIQQGNGFRTWDEMMGHRFDVSEGKMDEIFRQLAAGAKFDRRRSGEEMAVFSRPQEEEEDEEEIGEKKKPRKLKKAVVFQEEAPPVASTAQVEEMEVENSEDKDDGIEIFGGAKKEKKEKKKEPKPKNEDEEAEEEGDEKETKCVLAKVLKLAPEYERKAKEIARLHKENGLKVCGNDVVAPISSFSELGDRFPGFDRRLTAELAKARIEAPTPVQMQAIPSMCGRREVIGVSATGSGKTLAFVIPIVYLAGLEKRAEGGKVVKAEEGKRGYRSIVLSPTRELAQQTFRVFQRFSASTRPRFRSCLLTKGVAAKGSTPPSGVFDVLVATPLRLLRMIRDGSVDLRRVSTLVFDEADRLFDDQFVEQIDEIASAVREQVATSATGGGLRVCLFSATMMPQVEQLASSLMRDPVRILVGRMNVPLSSIKQSLVFAGNEEGKLIAIRRMISGGIQLPALVFVQSKERAQDLFKTLIGEGIPVEVIHSERPPEQRAQIVDSFRAGKIWILIATDVMARGMDFRGVSCVVNYDFPQSVTSYIHRIGRTGRAGAEGTAITFFTEKDSGMLRSIANSIKAAGCDVPDWMLQLKPLAQKDRKYLATHAPHRLPVGTGALPSRSDRLSERERKLLVTRRPSMKKTTKKRNSHQPAPKKRKH